MRPTFDCYVLPDDDEGGQFLCVDALKDEEGFLLGGYAPRITLSSATKYFKKPVTDKDRRERVYAKLRLQILIKLSRVLAALEAQS